MLHVVLQELALAEEDVVYFKDTLLDVLNMLQLKVRPKRLDNIKRQPNPLPNIPLLTLKVKKLPINNQFLLTINQSQPKICSIPIQEGIFNNGQFRVNMIFGKNVLGTGDTAKIDFLGCT